MNDARAWLADRLEDTPALLRDRMFDALDASAATAPLHEQLARAAQASLERALQTTAREQALELLTADALFTHACEAAAEAGSDTMLAFAQDWSVDRFQQLFAAAK